ncbi:hypothetical protein PanWU01x14_300830, partial [Parasponia andersonii]
PNPKLNKEDVPNKAAAAGALLSLLSLLLLLLLLFVFFLLLLLVLPKSLMVFLSFKWLVIFACSSSRDLSLRFSSSKLNPSTGESHHPSGASFAASSVIFCTSFRRSFSVSKWPNRSLYC